MDPLGPDPLIRSFERHLYAENRSARTVTTCLIASGRPTARLWSSRPTTELNPGIAVAGIYLYEAGKFRGYAYFYPDATPLAPAVIDAVNGAIFVHFNLSQFAGVLQLLREERPVYLYEFGPSNAGLMTGGGPTGEEEGLSG